MENSSYGKKQCSRQFWNAAEREHVRLDLNPNASEASYKPKQRSYRKTKLILFFWGDFIREPSKTSRPNQNDERAQYSWRSVMLEILTQYQTHFCISNQYSTLVKHSLSAAVFTRIVMAFAIWKISFSNLLFYNDTNN